MKSREVAALHDEAITPESVFFERRKLIAALGFAGLSSLVGLDRAIAAAGTPPPPPPTDKLTATEEKYALHYNNYVEFSTDKKAVQKVSEKWKPLDPWKIHVKGLVEKPLILDLKELLASVKQEDRTYRFRCVEAWSMVLPWRGFPLSELIVRARPKATAKFVKFTSFTDESVMPNIKGRPNYPWPYTEGLTMADAMHPLSIVGTGLYGKPLKNQNGGPVRIVVPWKYGFKSLKALISIEFTDQQPVTFWNKHAPDYCGFYANVNPNVSNPRWSQARETLIDGSFVPKKIPTLMYNGYEKEVAHLYKDLDLVKNI